MPCMCGDICCPSCGPAQGNNRCPVCRAWASDGGCVDPAVCEAGLEEVARQEEMMYQSFIEEQRLAEEYWQQERQKDEFRRWEEEEWHRLHELGMI